MNLLCGLLFKAHVLVTLFPFIGLGAYNSLVLIKMYGIRKKERQREKSVVDRCKYISWIFQFSIFLSSTMYLLFFL